MATKAIKKKRFKNGKPFLWGSEEALKYEEISSDLLTSDILAYYVVYGILDPYDKAILDYGCFLGDSTNRIYNKGARVAVGIDVDPAYVTKAKKRYGTNVRRKFWTIEEGKPIPVPSGFTGYHGAAMTFVHPTISSAQVLERVIHSVYEVLLPGGKLVMLGLHPESLKTDEIFLNYAHKMPKSGEYADGEPFLNTLKKEDGSNLKFYDYCWTTKSIKNFLRSAGFGKVKEFGLNCRLRGEVGDLLREAASVIELKKGIDFCERPEFNVPLYQIFVGTK